MKDVMGDLPGKKDFEEIVNTLEEHPPTGHRMILPIEQREQSPASDYLTVTPQGTLNPEPPGSGAPFLPNNFERTLPFPNHNATTPTPSGIGLASI